MRRFIFVFVFLMNANAAFAKDRPLAEVSVKQGSELHRFTLLVDSAKPVYRISFQEGRARPKEKTVTKSQADYIRNEATRIIWNSEYRKPASAKTCSQYASVSSGDEKTKVCLENRKALAMSYGLLKTMSQIFQ